MVRSALFSLYVLGLLAGAVLTFHALDGPGIPAWVPWTGAFGILIGFGAPYVFWPDRISGKREKRPYLGKPNESLTEAPDQARDNAQGDDR